MVEKGGENVEESLMVPFGNTIELGGSWRRRFLNDSLGVAVVLKGGGEEFTTVHADEFWLETMVEDKFLNEADASSTTWRTYLSPSRPVGVIPRRSICRNWPGRVSRGFAVLNGDCVVFAGDAGSAGVGEMNWGGGKGFRGEVLAEYLLGLVGEEGQGGWVLQPVSSEAFGGEEVKSESFNALDDERIRGWRGF
ncbi:hypothetical protein BC829DRAFT_419752 [Chytridium lagenaria]|nr:hypothetical protein BC829DRAFT_419752 [Chytridium lagenaria]